MVRENPPIMVLKDETPDALTFRFENQGWALFTGVLGIILALLAAKVRRIRRILVDLAPARAGCDAFKEFHDIVLQTRYCG